MTERNNALSWELIHGLDDLESSTFREHWYYRLNALKIQTDATVNPSARKMCEHIADCAREFERRRNHV